MPQGAHMSSASRTNATNLVDLKREYSTVRRQYLFAFAGVLSLLLAGAVIYHHLLHLTWVNAFYFCTITLATVGYGDITPTTDASKIFTIFYIIVGIGTFTAFVGLFVRHASLRRELKRAKRHKE